MQVAKDFDLKEAAVREWVKQTDLDDGARTDGLTSDGREELRGYGGSTADCAKTSHPQAGYGFLSVIVNE